MNAHALLLSTVTALALSLGAVAAAQAQSVSIEHAVARVVVIPERRADIGVEIVPGTANLPSLEVVRAGGRVQIDGGLSRARVGLGNRTGISKCNQGNLAGRQPGEGAHVEVRGIGKVELAQAPLIVLRTPLDVEVDASGAVFGSVGPGVRSLDLGSGGCGTWTVGNVEQGAVVSLAGSGSVRMGSSRSLDVSIGGSGTVVARETGNFKGAIGGSGDIVVGEANGSATIQIGGSGDVQIRGGRVDKLDVSIAGSGDVRFDGVAGDVSSSIAGSGDVRVREVTGRISRATVGSGRLHVGG